MRFRLILLILVSVLLSGCGYNTIQQQDEAVKAQWSEVLNQYQRRADLVPNLVATVKGFAAQEQAVLVAQRAQPGLRTLMSFIAVSLCVSGTEH